MSKNSRPSSIMLLRWMCFMVSITASFCQQHASITLQEKELHIEELTQIMGYDDPSGTNHSIRVIISDHRPLENAQYWEFLQHTFEGEFINYRINGNGENPSLQKELIFMGNLLDSNSHMLKATDGSQDLAMEYNVIDIFGMRTNVTWVGEQKEKESSSLRVAVDHRVGEMSVGESKCNSSKSPCYFIKPQQKDDFQRCINVTMHGGTIIKQCDERVRSFSEMKPLSLISLREDGSLEVEFIYQDKILDVEVIVYDPDNHTNIFSPYPFTCRFTTGKFWDEGEKMPCRQYLHMPEDQLYLSVLVVIIEDWNAKESTLQDFKRSDTKVTWVGDGKGMQSSSLRVEVDDKVGEMSIGKSKCKSSRSPCYYIKPNIQQSFQRCIDITRDDGTHIKQCDETVKSFHEITSLTSIYLREDGNLELEFIYHDQFLDVEVVAYDPDDSDNIFSAYPYKCRFTEGTFWREGKKISCRQMLQMTGDQFQLMVLVVIVQEGDAKESTVLKFDRSISKVTWVGEDKEKESSSLRVVVRDRMEEIIVGESKCNTSMSPCYYIKPQLKQALHQCMSITGEDDRVIKQWDNRVRAFNEMTSLPSISLRKDGKLKVEFIYNNKLLEVEVVTFDPDNSTNIFSTYPYKCRFTEGKIWKEGEKMPCRQTLQLPEDQFHMMVLVVIVEDGDAKESTLQYFDTTSDKQLRIRKITKSLDDNNTSVGSYNTHMTISHQTLSRIKLWRLVLLRNGRIHTYETTADGSDPSTQSTLTFKGAVDGADSITLLAINNSNHITAGDYLVMDIGEMGSEVSWVGAEGGSPMSVVRVLTGNNFEEIEVEKFTCTKEKSPCYYTSLHSTPNYVERCNENYWKEKSVKLCDDRIVGFTETNKKPSITLLDDSHLKVEFTRSEDEKFGIEVVVFDYDDHSIVYSDKGNVACHVIPDMEMKTSQIGTCAHAVNLPKDKVRFIVLTVKVDDEGKMISSTIDHSSNQVLLDTEGPKRRSNEGAIIGAIFGAMFGLALIGFFIFYVMKRMEARSNFHTNTNTNSTGSLRVSQTYRRESSTNNAIEEKNSPINEECNNLTQSQE